MNQKYLALAAADLLALQRPVLVEPVLGGEVAPVEGAELELGQHRLAEVHQVQRSPEEDIVISTHISYCIGQVNIYINI